jgi:hypothetical protein
MIDTIAERERLLAEARRVANEARFSTDLCLRLASVVELEIAERARTRRDYVGDLCEEDDSRAHNTSRRPHLVLSATIIPFPINRTRR